MKGSKASSNVLDSGDGKVSDFNWHRQKHQVTILQRQIIFIVPVTISLYVFFQYLVRFSNICRDPSDKVASESITLSEWVLHVNVSVVLWFAIHLIYMLVKFYEEFMKGNLDVCSSYAGGFSVALIAMSAYVLTLYPQTNNICVDSFGYV